MVVVLPSGGSLLGRILLLLSTSSFWLGDVIMTSPALLTDAVLTSLESLAIVVGAVFIRLQGVKFVFSKVSSNLTNFPVLPNPTPYSESNCYPRISAFVLSYLISSMLSGSLIFSVSCAKFWLTGFAYLPTFLAAWKLDFSFPSFSNLRQSRVL